MPWVFGELQPNEERKREIWEGGKKTNCYARYYREAFETLLPNSDARDVFQAHFKSCLPEEGRRFL